MKLFGCLPLEDFEVLSESTAELIRENKHSNIVVIGASGFIGRWLATYFTFMQLNGEFLGTLSLLVRDEGKITEFQNMPGQTVRKVIRIDTISADSFNHLNSERVVVFFAASNTTLTPVKSHDSSKEAVLLAEKVIFHLPDRNIVFIHLSSGGVYEPDARTLSVIPGGHRTQSASEIAYINEKILLERWAREQSVLGRFVARNPRLFSFYGPGLQLDRHFAIGEFMGKALSGLPILIKGNPGNLRSYLHPADAVFQLLMQSQTLVPVHSQLGSANPMTILSAGKTIAQDFGITLQVSENSELKLDNYVPQDVPRVVEKDFEAGISQWRSWLTSRA
jgi:dTDP-glucose 4,6-dehydratase